MAIAMWGRPPAAANSPVNALGPVVTMVLAFGSFVLAVFQGMKKNRTAAVTLAVGGMIFLLAAFTWVDAIPLPPFANSALFIGLMGWAVVSLTLAALRGRGNLPLFTAFSIHWLLSSFIVYS